VVRAQIAGWSVNAPYLGQGGHIGPLKPAGAGWTGMCGNTIIFDGLKKAKDMNRIILVLFVFALTRLSVHAQQAETKSPQETARTFTRQGDYANAIVVLNSALQTDAKNMELQKDLAFNYYLLKDYDKGLNVARPLVERPDADVQAYQTLALLYKAIDEYKECEKLYRAGIKRFPRSGVLYSEYGEMLWSKDDYSAIKQWEKGIEIDPNYSSNYFNASKYYFFTSNKVWALIYGEVFVNIESYSKRTAEMKQLLLEGYKKLYADGTVQKDQDSKSPFAAAWLNVISPLAFTIKDGITAESLAVLRTKFIINWYNTYPTNFPFRLFDYQHQLLNSGLFDAYNEWLFGAVGNPTAFQSWSKTHGDEYAKFVSFQQGRVFKLPEGQYYQAAVK
jgi:tetratricopeptide (TPR) repeat protein